MKKLVFILGSPNSADGELSSISISRVTRALALQKTDQHVVLLATGGFGDHFNVSDVPHRALVHEYLLDRGASIEVGAATDLLSSNTVEDVQMILAFAKERACSDYGVVTSGFHVARCRYIFECLDPTNVVDFFTAEDPLDLDAQTVRHEATALARLVAQGGVLIGDVLYPHRRS